MSQPDEIPRPSRVLLRMEFDDGSFREFTVHQPRKVTLNVSSPLPGLGLYGVTSPYQIMPPRVPHVEITLDAEAARPIDVRDSRFDQADAGLLDLDQDVSAGHRPVTRSVPSSLPALSLDRLTSCCSTSRSSPPSSSPL